MPNSPKLISRKFVLWSFGIIFFILGLGATLFFVGKNYAGSILNEVIKRETNGFYQLEFESIDFNFLEKRINVNNLALRVDSTKDMSTLGVNNIYEIQLSELIIDLESIWAIYLEKELMIKSVRVMDPDIDMLSLDRNEKRDFSFEAGNMYQAISDYLKVLKIDYFRIQDGELQYGGNEFSLGSINFLVKNLVMDSTSHANKVFYSESIELEIRNQKFHLPDSIHEVTFDKFVLSTQDSILSFENLRVRPLASSGITFEGQNDLNVYDIHVPKLSFKGVDYIAAYQDNHLKIEELILDEPTVFVDDESHAAAAKKGVDNSLLSLIFNIFGALDVGKLRINNAHVDLKIDGVDKYQRFKVEESNIVFYNIHLDTSNYRFDHRFKYFEDIELDIHNYTYLLPDSVHTAHFDLLRINTFSSELLFENVTVSHERGGNESKVRVDVLMPRLKLQNVDFQRAIADKILNVGLLEIPDMSFAIRNTGSTSKKEAPDVKVVYKALSPFFREVSIDQLRFSNWNLTLPKGISLDRIDLNLSNLHMSSATRRFSDLVRYSNLKIAGCTVNQDSIHIQGGQLLAAKSMTSLQLIDWRVNVEKSNQKISGTFDTLLISDLSIDSLVQGNYSTFKRIQIANPDFQLNIHSSDSNNKPMNPGIEKEVIISQGKLSMILDSLQLSMEGLDADVFVGDSTAFRSLGVEKIKLISEKHNHTLNLQKWKYDTLGGQMDFQGIRIEPINKEDTSKILVDANIPSLRLVEFEQAKFFDENHLFASLIRLSQPDINIRVPKKQDKPDSTAAKTTFTMAVQRLQLDTGNISIEPMGNPTLHSLELTGISTVLHGFDYPKAHPFENESVFYSDSLNLNIAEVHPHLKSGDELSFKNADYSSVNRSFHFKDIHFVADEKNMFFDVPQLDVAGLDVALLVREGQVSLDSLLIETPTGVTLPSKSTAVSNSFHAPIAINHISINDISWNYRDTKNEQDINLNNGYLIIDKFESSDTLTLKNIREKIGKLSFEAGPFEMSLPENYTLSLKKYRFDHPENKLQLNDIQLTSGYTPKEYSQVIEEQRDWFDVGIEKIMVNKIDVEEMISNGSYSAENMTFDGLDALIYRDKGVPFPEDQVRSLPQENIRNISQTFQVDTINVNGRIRYQEKPDDYFTHGVISFDQLNASLLNVGNADIARNENMLLTATGKLMEVGRFDVRGAFNMNAQDEEFSLSGSIQEFPLDSMNQMLGPVANVNIKSGYAKELYFNFSANDTLARGDMRFRYDDLKIQILNAKTHDTQGLGQGIKTFFANTFVVKSKNPSYLLFLRKGTIFQERDTSRAIFNYWGKSLLSGAVSSIGVHKSDKAEKKFERNISD
jgi:hypothetical protein